MCRPGNEAATVFADALKSEGPTAVMSLVAEVAVREAAADDMADVSAVMSEATAQLRAVYRPGRDALVRAGSAKEVRWLIAVVGREIVGALRYVIEPDRLHLGLGVRPEHQRKGVARALVGALAAKASCLGLPKLSLYTVKETGNVPIFARLGFRVVREEPAKDAESVTGQPLTDVYMERLV